MEITAKTSFLVPRQELSFNRPSSLSDLIQLYHSDMFNDGTPTPEAKFRSHTHIHGGLTGLSFESRTPQLFERWSEGQSGERLSSHIQT